MPETETQSISPSIGSTSEVVESANLHTCSSCEKSETAEGEFDSCEGCSHLFCDFCRSDSFNSCDSCDLYECSSCFETNFCSNCELSYCDSCFREHEHDEDEDSANIRFRKCNLSDKSLVDRHFGRVVRSSRKFGVEIEAIYPDTETIETLSRDDSIHSALGISEDGSLSADSGAGIEFQTPLLAGEKGEDFIKSFTQRLNRDGFSVNTSCGLHVHISGEDYYRLKAEERFLRLRALFLFYLVFDEVIRSFLPHSRRNNNYCHSLTAKYSVKNVLLTKDLIDLEFLWYQTQSKQEISIRKRGKDSSRYRGINFHSLLADKHIEIRYHSGTLSQEKILQWVALHVRILDTVKKMDIETLTKTLKAVEKKNDSQIDKIRVMFQLLKLSKSSKNYFYSRIKKFNPSFVEEGN